MLRLRACRSLGVDDVRSSGRAVVEYIAVDGEAQQCGTQLRDGSRRRRHHGRCYSHRHGVHGPTTAARQTTTVAGILSLLLAGFRRTPEMSVLLFFLPLVDMLRGEFEL